MTSRAARTCADAEGSHEQVCPSVFLVGGPDLSDERDCLVYALDLGDIVLVDCGCGPDWPPISRLRLVPDGVERAARVVVEWAQRSGR